MGVCISATDQSLDSQISAAQSTEIDDTAAVAVLLNRFEGLAMSIARSLTSNWSLQQDAAQGARLGLVKAVRSHTVGTPGFPSYAARYMRGEARRTLMATSARESFIDPSDYELLNDVTHDQSSVATFELIDLISVLRPEQQAITKAHYIGGAGLGDLAGALGVSKPAVCQRLATIHRTLRGVAEAAAAA